LSEKLRFERPIPFIMPRALNMNSKTRHQAVLHYLEAVVRDQVPDADDPSSDYATLHDCVKSFSGDLGVLRMQASALWRPEFGKALDSAHSMRCVPIHCNKDPKRQEYHVCDACGRKERMCRFAIDLAGGQHTPKEWCGDPAKIPKLWCAFVDNYTAEKESDTVPNELRSSDLGRFYIGMTCLRKAKLHFLISTMLAETMYNFWATLCTFDDAEYDDGMKSVVNEDSVKELMKRKEKLELCVANEKREDLPPIMIDSRFWELIDDARSGCPKSAIKERAGNTLGVEECEEWDDDDDGFIDDEEEEEEMLEDSDVEEVEMPQKASGGKKKRRCVVVDDEEEFVALPPQKRRSQERGESSTAVRKSGRVRGLAAGVSVPNSSTEEEAAPTEAGDDEDDEEAAAAEAAAEEAAPPPPPPPPPPRQEEEEEGGDNDDEEVRVCDLPNMRRVRPNSQPSARNEPRSAVRCATAMRIPPRDGTPAALPARRQVLLNLLRLSHTLTVEQRDGDASIVDAAVVTMRELIEIADRARGTR